MKKEMKMLSVVFIVVLVGVFIVAWRYYGGYVIASTELSPRVDASCTGFYSGSAIKGDAGCYTYLSSKNRYRVYPDQNAKPITIVNYITYDGIVNQICSSSYCMTPHDSDVIEVRDSSGDRDCVDHGNVFRGGGYNGNGCGELVAYYPLDGNANDLSGYANNGIVYGAVPTTGKIGQGYQFDGNDYINIGNPSQIQLTNNFTISAWVKLPVQDGYYGIVGKMKLISRADGMNGWMLYRGSSGGLALPQQYRFTIGDGEWPPHFTESIINHPDNEWHYVTAIAEDSEIRVYVDGVQTGSIAILDSIVDSGEYASIGRQYSTHVSGEYGYAYGIIDEVKIWNYVLSDEEIHEEYEVN